MKSIHAVKSFIGLGAAFAAFLSTHAFAATTVYNVASQVGGGSVAGTITTNGKIGVIGQDDVTAYFLTFMRNGIVTGIANSANGLNREISGDALTASATDLFFDYSSTTIGAGFYFISDAGSFEFFCSNANSGFGCNNGLSNQLVIFTDLQSEAVVRSGVQSINFSDVGGAVPEPATWAMMIGGFGIVGGAMRRRRVTATVSFA